MKQGEIRIFSLSILFLFGTQGLAAPSTNVAWSSEIRALVASGDFESGEKLAGQCANDIYRRMRLIAAKLSELEIKALADYYASLESR